jgi:hypothetical protein
MRSLTISTGKRFKLGFRPRRISSRVHCTNALMFLRVPGRSLICPWTPVRPDYILKWSSSSLNVKSMHDEKTLSKISSAMRVACVSPMKRASLSTLHAIIASRTDQLAAMFKVRWSCIQNRKWRIVYVCESWSFIRVPFKAVIFIRMTEVRLYNAEARSLCHDRSQVTPCRSTYCLSMINNNRSWSF